MESHASRGLSAIAELLVDVNLRRSAAEIRHGGLCVLLLFLIYVHIYF